MARRLHVHTLAHVLDRRGFFDSNPANFNAQTDSGTRLYKGPVQHPKMMYHPDGLENILIQGEVIATPLGPRVINEHKEPVTIIAEDAGQEKELLAKGWLTDAREYYERRDARIAEERRTRPQVGGASMEEELVRLRKELANMQTQKALADASAA